MNNKQLQTFYVCGMAFFLAFVSGYAGAATTASTTSGEYLKTRDAYIAKFKKGSSPESMGVKCA